MFPDTFRGPPGNPELPNLKETAGLLQVCGVSGAHVAAQSPLHLPQALGSAQQGMGLAAPHLPYAGKSRSAWG